LIILSLLFVKSLIQQYNAGYPEPCTVEVPTLGKRDVKMLLSYNRNDDETVYQVIAYFMRAFHKRVLPFASDSFSGYYCIKDGSAVVFLDEEESTVYPVSESIASFFNMLA